MAAMIVNKIKGILFIGFLALMLTALFPAREYKGNTTSMGGREKPTRGFLFSPNLILKNRVGIAMERMILEWVFIISATGLMIIFVNPRSD